MPLYRGEPAQCHPAFTADSDAACGERSGPVDISAPNIVYTVEDDEAINSHIRMKGKSGRLFLYLMCIQLVASSNLLALCKTFYWHLRTLIFMLR